MKHVVESKRNEMLISILCKNKTVVTGTATIRVDGLEKKNHANGLLTDLEFEFAGNTIYMQHCWLQERDFSEHMREKVRATGETYVKVRINFAFYEYRDAIDRGMHGVTIHNLNVIKQKKKK